MESEILGMLWPSRFQPVLTHLSPLIACFLSIQFNIQAKDSLIGTYKTQSLKTENKKPFYYRTSSPDKMDSGKKYPLLVFFHGAGGRGKDNQGHPSCCNIFSMVYNGLYLILKVHPIQYRKRYNLPILTLETLNPQKTLNERT